MEIAEETSDVNLLIELEMEFSWLEYDEKEGGERSSLEPDGIGGALGAPEVFGGGKYCLKMSSFALSVKVFNLAFRIVVVIS